MDRWDYVGITPILKTYGVMHSCPFGMGSNEFSKFCMNEDQT